MYEMHDWIDKKRRKFYKGIIKICIFVLYLLQWILNTDFYKIFLKIQKGFFKAYFYSYLFWF